MQFDLYIFDFDGTIMDTEPLHYKSWMIILSDYLKKDINIDIREYQKYFHSLDKLYSKNYLLINYDITYDIYDELYNLKQDVYEKTIRNNDINIQFIPGAEDFLNMLITNNKKFVIVSNASRVFLNIFKEKYQILNNADKIYTKEDFINKKPNPECYLQVLNDYANYPRKIGFEDSLIGMHALYHVKNITPILIYNKNYFYEEYILKNYENIYVSENYNIENLNICENEYENNDKIFINNILNNNITQLQNNFENMNNIISHITVLLKNMNNHNNIYLTGMGKSGYVCKKCASTWQSLSIKCSYIDLPNLPHGDFGIFRDGDVIILISKSGNTDEVVNILNYLKNIIKKKIMIISIIANKDSKMESLSNFTYVLNNIRESDTINMTPSTSSLIFMALLDGIAINLRKDITANEFKLNHPSGQQTQQTTFSAPFLA
jgi:D-arabinose 5-phosphate isomerase GutQ/beta-phosphoglucomutase-like phosphatase (HAD superfamily)